MIHQRSPLIRKVMRSGGILSQTSDRFQGMKSLISTALLLALIAAPARAQVNAGEQKEEPDLPFTMTQVTTFNLPWRIAFLPDGRMLITEKPGALWLVTQDGAKTPVTNIPASVMPNQGGI